MRIAYYTGWLRPDSEGTSREVFALAQHFGASYILGMSPHDGFRLIWSKRAFGLHPRAYLALNLALPLLERTQELSHIYDELGCWHYLKNLKCKPIILTATAGQTPLPFHFYDQVFALVVDSEYRYNQMLQLGFPKQKLRLIYAGIDTNHFKSLHQPPLAKPFKVLFATAPPTSAELEGRGVWQILEAAQLLPEIEFILVWRSWGDSLQTVKNKIRELRLSNITLIDRFVSDMRLMYHRVHCVLAPFKEDGGKSCPTSILEACACGLPVIIGEGVGIGNLLINEGAGLRSGDDGYELAEALKSVKQSWERMRTRAREVSECYFPLSKFINEYKILYGEALEFS